MKGTRVMGTTACVLLLCGMAMASAEALPLLGLAHVGVRVSDLEKSRGFYHGALGYEEAFDTRKADGDPVAVAFFKVNDTQFIELFPGLKPERAQPMTHVALQTGDIEKLHKMLDARGVPVGPIKKGPRDGNLSCAIRQLPGQSLDFLEFVQYLPDSLHSKSIGKAMGGKRISLRLEHAGIPATNMVAAIKFCKEKLGFVETWSRTDDKGRLFLIHLRIPGGSGDYIELSNHPEPMKRKAAGTAAHMSLLVPDIKAAYKAISERGLTEGPTEPRFGKDERWQFNLFDPDGTRVECMQPKGK